MQLRNCEKYFVRQLHEKMSQFTRKQKFPSYHQRRNSIITDVEYSFYLRENIEINHERNFDIHHIRASIKNMGTKYGNKRLEL